MKKVHDLLQSHRVLAYYDPIKYTELIVDVSPVGLGANLAQKESEDEEGGKIVVRCRTEIQSDRA